MDQIPYERSVSYAHLDPFKVAASRAASETSRYVTRLKITALEETRGESVFLFDNGNHFIGHVEEGLGTKSLVADAYDAAIGGPSHYDSIAQDTFAMIVNDMITLGVFPFSIAMHLAVGDKKWMTNESRLAALIAGWKNSCRLAMCCWAGGETPILKEVIMPEAAVLSGSAVGKSIGRVRFGAENVQAGDQIICFESSGIHANGLSQSREIAATLDKGYLTPVPGSDKTFGELLLRPTHIYARVIEALVRHGITIRYGVNITGHGWRKLMRAPQSLTYVVEKLPSYLDPLFPFIQERAGVSDQDMYSTLNMGAGFAIFVPPSEVAPIKSFVQKAKFPFQIFRAGHVEIGAKQVYIEPKKILFGEDTLAIR